MPRPTVDLIECARRSFVEVAADIAGALVYLDEGVGEVVHFAAGAGFLLGLGARNVLSLEGVGSNPIGGVGSSNEDDSSAPWVAVEVTGLPAPATAPLAIFTARALPDAEEDVVRCIACHPRATRVTVFCAVSEVGEGRRRFWIDEATRAAPTR